MKDFSEEPESERQRSEQRALPNPQAKKPSKFAWLLKRRGRGIRTPGTLRYNGFQDRRVRPLRQPSVFNKIKAKAL